MNTEELPKISPRQLEVLVNVFLGEDHSVRRAVLAGDPVWGRRVGWAGNGGGSRRRMLESMEAIGLFPLVTSERSGRSWYSNRTITAKAMRLLRHHYPDLPDINQRIAEREQAERDQAEAEAIRDAENERRRLAEAERREAWRTEQMALILQDYQVAHTLTDDQLRAMWFRVVDTEMAR